jgi:hypothetical protein
MVYKYILYACHKIVFCYEYELKCLPFCFLFSTDFTTRAYVMLFMFISDMHFVCEIQR